LNSFSDSNSLKAYLDAIFPNDSSGTARVKLTLAGHGSSHTFPESAAGLDVRKPDPKHFEDAPYLLKHCDKKHLDPEYESLVKGLDHDKFNSGADPKTETARMTARFKEVEAMMKPGKKSKKPKTPALSEKTKKGGPTDSDDWLRIKTLYVVANSDDKSRDKKTIAYAKKKLKTMFGVTDDKDDKKDEKWNDLKDGPLKKLCGRADFIAGSAQKDQVYAEDFRI